MKTSDAPYKLLFQDPGIFEETVRLVAPQLAAALDFETTTSLDKEHLTALALERVQDKLRRVELREGTLRNGRRPYVLVLIEFQSSHHPDMTWRVREYLYLVEAGLRETGRLQQEGALPALLSILIHNGDRPWRAPPEWAGPLTRDGPPGRVPMYATVDLQALSRGRDAEGRELVPGSRLETLAELESAPPDRLPGLVLAAFRRYRGAESTALRRGFHMRVGAALAHRGIAGALPPLTELERQLAAGAEQAQGGDMTAMLDATLERWEAEKLAEGEAQGRIALLRRQATWRFGANVAGEMAELLADMTDLSRLDMAGEWLLSSDSGEQLLDRLRGSDDGASR